ncbi:MAG: hypothetical protein ACXWL5_05010 [Candidatus Chromulinivorax sp.]
MKILKSFLISFLMISFAGLQGSDTSDTSFESEVSIEPVKDLTIKYCPEEAKFKVIQHRKFEEPTAVDRITKNILTKHANILCDELNNLIDFDIKVRRLYLNGYRIPEKSITYFKGEGTVTKSNEDYIKGKLEELKQKLHDKHFVFIDWK